jgi:lipopolysaccharide export system permease protein
VTVLQFRDDDKLVRRIDASALLEERNWRLFDAVVAPGQQASPIGEYVLPTTMTARGCRKLRRARDDLVLGTAQLHHAAGDGGFSAHRHRLYWHSLLAQPLLLGALVLIAATLALRQTRAAAPLPSWAAS